MLCIKDKNLIIYNNKFLDKSDNKQGELKYLSNLRKRNQKRFHD
jgi:hypothetical protein